MPALIWTSLTLIHTSQHVLAVANSSRGILPRLRDIVIASPQTMPGLRSIGQRSRRRMSEWRTKKRRSGLENETVLQAYVTVHLTSGDSFELLPFQDDVKRAKGHRPPR